MFGSTSYGKEPLLNRICPCRCRWHSFGLGASAAPEPYRFHSYSVRDAQVRRHPVAASSTVIFEVIAQIGAALRGGASRTQRDSPNTSRNQHSPSMLNTTESRRAQLLPLCWKLLLVQTCRNVCSALHRRARRSFGCILKFFFRSSSPGFCQVVTHRHLRYALFSSYHRRSATSNTRNNRAYPFFFINLP